MTSAITHPILWLLVRRDLKSRYAGSTLGVVWNAIHPIVMIGIYVVVFSSLMSSRAGPGANKLTYLTHLVAGMIPWFLFSEVVSRTTNVLVENAHFLRKMSLPGEVLHLSVLTNAALIHTGSLLVFALMLVMIGGHVSWHIVLAFPVMWALGLFGMGVGMVLSVLNLVVRDVGQLVSILLNLCFWFTPIVYYRSILPPRVDQFIAWNPMVAYISLIQSIFGSPEANFRGDYYPTMVIVPFLTLLIGRRFLHENRGEILDQL